MDTKMDTIPLNRGDNCTHGKEISFTLKKTTTKKQARTVTRNGRESKQDKADKEVCMLLNSQDGVILV